MQGYSPNNYFRADYKYHLGDEVRVKTNGSVKRAVITDEGYLFNGVTCYNLELSDENRPLIHVPETLIENGEPKI